MFLVYKENDQTKIKKNKREKWVQKMRRGQNMIDRIGVDKRINQSNEQQQQQNNH